MKALILSLVLALSACCACNTKKKVDIEDISGGTQATVIDESH